MLQVRSCWTPWPTHGTSSSEMFCPCCRPSSTLYRYTHRYTHTLTCLYSHIENCIHVCLCLCVFSGKGALCASVGSAPLQEHHHPQPETGRGSVSTPSQSPSFYHTDAANTAGSLCLYLFLIISHAFYLIHTHTHTYTHIQAVEPLPPLSSSS